MKELGFGVVGLGVMGQRRISVLQKLQGVVIRAVCDTDPAKVRVMGKELGCRYFEQYRDMLNEDIDCVVVCLPNYLHYDASISFLRAGKNVMCEKPLAIAPSQAWDMVRTAKAHGVYLKTAANHRYMPNIVKAHEIVSSGGIGRPLFFRGFIGHKGQRFSSNWFLNPQMSGGGTLMDNGCHLLDLSRWFVGDAVECMGYVATLHLQIAPLEDNAFATIKTNNNAFVMISSSWTEWFGYLYFEIYGGEGFVIVDCRYGNRITYGRRYEDHVKAYDFTDLPQQSYRLEMSELVSNLREHKPLSPSGEDGAKALEMIHAIYESSRTGVSRKCS